MSAQVVILYTHNLRGNLDLLPRLYHFMRDLRRGGSETLPHHSQTLLLDLGDSCSPDVWHCDVTGGRSTLLVLDAMGYHAANAAHLSAESRDKLAANLLQMALVDTDHAWEYEDMLVTCRGDPVEALTRRGVPWNASTQLQILLIPANSTHLEDHRLHLAALETGQIGLVRLTLDDTATLTHFAVHALPPATLPDPTIAAAVEFVLSEARLYRDRRSSD